jgi:hypothetical protein
MGAHAGSPAYVSAPEISTSTFWSRSRSVRPSLRRRSPHRLWRTAKTVQRCRRIRGTGAPAVLDRITDLADQQFSVIPARVPGAEHRTDERAGGTRPLRPPGKRNGLPDRCPSHQCTRLPGRPSPGNRAGRRADAPDARPTRRPASSQHTPPARPGRAVRGKPSGYTDRASGMEPVRYDSYASVDPATRRPTATQGDPC